MNKKEKDVTFKIETSIVFHLMTRVFNKNLPPQKNTKDIFYIFFKCRKCK